MNSSRLALQGYASNTAHGEAFAPGRVVRGFFSTDGVRVHACILEDKFPRANAQNARSRLPHLG